MSVCNVEPRRMKVETCTNCDRTIGKLEQAHLYENQIVCIDCIRRLSPQSDSQNLLGTTPPPCKPVKRNDLQCHICGGRLKNKTVSSGNATGLAGALIVLLIGIVLCATGLGAIIGIPLIICALFMGGKRHKVLKCVNCGAIAAEI